MCVPLEGPSITILNPDYQKKGQRPSCRFFGYTLFFSFFSTDKLFIVTYGAGAGKKSFHPYRLLPSNIIGSLQQFLVSAVAFL